MANSELFLAPLRRQDAVTSSRMEGAISTIEELYRLEAEEDAGSADPHREARDDDIETYLYSARCGMHSRPWPTARRLANI